MAKQKRPAAGGRPRPRTGAGSRTAVKTKKSPSKARARAAAPPRRTSTRAPAAAKARPTRAAAPAPVPPPPPAPPAAPKKPGFYEAVAIYERGVQALQKHDFRGAADSFRAVLERYPEERELLERARLYLRVCERETERQPQGPRTPAERVYAATVALNSGDHAGALEHLQRALDADPESDHAHYTMAVALGMKGRAGEALTHLSSAIALNPDNRSLARQDPDLESLRGHDGFKAALETTAIRRRPRPRR